MPEAGAEATKAAETQFDPEALSDQGMVFGISTAIHTVLWHNPHNPPFPILAFFLLYEALLKHILIGKSTLINTFLKSEEEQQQKLANS